jgi:predicted nucleotidyltransferase
MSQATAKRKALAQRIAPAYAANPKVRAVLLAGSVARGTADDFSDIEIDVFWAEAPSDDELSVAIERAGATLLYRAADENEWADGFFIEGIKVDTSQFLVSTVERWLDAVVEQADTDVEKQLLIAAIQHSQALHGVDLAERWRAHAADYPDSLVRAMVEQYLVFRPRALLEMFAERDDLLILYRGLVEVESLIMSVLLGLNRLYIAHPAHKWLDWQVAQMRIAPPDLARRLRGILRDEPRAAVREIHTLIEELFNLVERDLPGFDTSAARAEFGQPRTLKQ